MTDYITHEEMLEIAAQRESQNARDDEIKKLFDEWFGELEGYSFRYERFWDDFDYATDSKDKQGMVQWLRTAYEMGYNEGQRLYGGTE
jgi:hypothetical protein